MGATRKPTQPLGAVAAALAAACTGTSTDNPYEHGRGGENAGSSQCEERRAVNLALDEESELGFSAQDVLTHLDGTHQETLRWHPLPQVSYGPESGVQGLTLSVTATSGARFVDYEPRSGGIELVAQCDDQVEIPVEVTLQTAQGALNERFATIVRARSAALGRIYHRLKAADIQGDLTLTAANGFTLSELSIAIEATRYGISGSIDPSLEKRDGDAASQAPGDALATWGLSGCDQDGTAVPRDAAIGGFSAEDVLATLSQHAQSGARWSGDGGDTSVALSFSPSVEGACAVLEESASAVTGSLGPAGSLRIPGVLTIVSAEGDFDGSLSGLIVAVPDASGGLESIAFEGASSDATSFTGIDVSAYDSASVRAQLMLSGDGSWSGSITLVGYDQPDCSTEVEQDPQGGASVPGCPGAEPHELVELQLGE